MNDSDSLFAWWSRARTSLRNTSSITEVGHSPILVKSPSMTLDGRRPRILVAKMGIRFWRNYREANHSPRTLRRSWQRWGARPGMAYPGQPHVVNRFMALNESEQALRQARRIVLTWAFVIYAGMILWACSIWSSAFDRELIGALCESSLEFLLVCGAVSVVDHERDGDDGTYQNLVENEQEELALEGLGVDRQKVFKSSHSSASIGFGASLAT